MLVLVRYTDDSYDIVEEYCLEYLIVTGKVVEFSRSDQWVTVSETTQPEKVESNLESSTEAYSGPERRRQSHRNLIHNPAVTPTS